MLADLRALAEQAANVSAPWPLVEDLTDQDPGFYLSQIHFIAACDPQTVLALVEVAEAAQAFLPPGAVVSYDPDGRVARLQAALAGLGITAEETSR